MDGNRKILTLIKSLFLILSLILYIFSLAVYPYARELGNFNDRAQVLRSGEIFLYDSYDTNESSMTDFLNRSDSFDIMSRSYNEVTSSPKLNYYEFSRQPVEIKGYFRGGREFGDDGTNELLNQEFDDGWLSSVKSLQGDWKFLNDYRILKQLSGSIDRSIFGEKYYFGDTIPIIAGSEYRKLYEVGDTVDCFFLGDQTELKIAAFLDTNASFTLADEEIELDNVIVMPMLSCDMNDRSRDNAILLSVKAEGFVRFDTEKEYRRQIRELENIVKDTGFRYDIAPLPKENDNIFKLTEITSAILMLLSIIALVISVRAFARDTLVQAAIGNRSRIVLKSIIISFTMFMLCETGIKHIFDGYPYVFKCAAGPLAAGGVVFVAIAVLAIIKSVRRGDDRCSVI